MEWEKLSRSGARGEENRIKGNVNGGRQRYLQREEMVEGGEAISRMGFAVVQTLIENKTIRRRPDGAARGTPPT